jgi:flagellar motor protein MotB
MRLKRSSARLLPPRYAKAADATWAVSYADFLMVLLSFFIIFFSADQKSPLHRIVLDFAGAGKAAQILGSGNATANGEAGSIFADLSSSVGKGKIRAVETADEIVLDLPENIYPKGSFAAPKAELEEVIQKLEKHSGEVRVIVIGHSDQTSFSKRKAVIDGNNLTLSSVRAAYASIYLQTRLPKVPISTRTTFRDERNTRSLTLVIQPISGRGDHE